jgi:L-rhamnose isomerase
MFEEQKSMPWPAIWDYYCESRGVPVGLGWLERVRAYEREMILRRAA